MVGGLKPLLNKAANIFADANSNSLIITDVASNVRRITSILQVADEAPEMPLKVEIVPLENATASSLAATLNQVFQDETQIANVLRTMGSAKNPEEMHKMIEKAKDDGAGIDMLPGTDLHCC